MNTWWAPAATMTYYVFMGSMTSRSYPLGIQTGSVLKAVATVLGGCQNFSAAAQSSAAGALQTDPQTKDSPAMGHMVFEVCEVSVCTPLAPKSCEARWMGISSRRTSTKDLESPQWRQSVCRNWRTSRVEPTHIVWWLSNGRKEWGSPAWPIYVTTANGRSEEMHMIGLVHCSHRELDTDYDCRIGSTGWHCTIQRRTCQRMKRGRNCTARAM